MHTNQTNLTKNTQRTTANGFSKSEMKLAQALGTFGRLVLSLSDRIIYMDHCIVIPPSLQKHVLYALNSAHQGVSGIKAMANTIIDWPVMTNNICSTRYNCKHCNEIAPSQPREPLMATPSPDWPFQQIFADYFE